VLARSSRKTGLSVNSSCLDLRPGMTLEQFQALRAPQDQRVRMTFSDGQVLTATLVSITTDFDASRHVVYDKVEWSALPHPEGEDGAYYTAGEGLVSCVRRESETKS
jgi:hypothetical protein